MALYVIEIDDNPFIRIENSGMSASEIHKAKGFGALVFDRVGMSRLKKLDDKYVKDNFIHIIDSAYNEGVDAAWKTAKKLFAEWSDQDIEAEFPEEWNNGGFRGLMKLDPQEAIYRTRQYEDRKAKEQEIKVGDEVEYIGEGATGRKFVVTKAGEFINGFNLSGEQFADKRRDNWRKTGKHFPEVSNLLEKMQKVEEVSG